MTGLIYLLETLIYSFFRIEYRKRLAVFKLNLLIRYKLKLNASFFKRLGFFLIGLALGIYFLGKIYEKKNATFEYGPNARTLKSIRNKPYFLYAEEVERIMEMNKIDTTAVNSLLYYGKIKFTKENRGKAPCHTYMIEPTDKTAPISISVQRCDSVATVVKLEVKS